MLQIYYFMRRFVETQTTGWEPLLGQDTFSFLQRWFVKTQTTGGESAVAVKQAVQVWALDKLE